MIYSGKITDAQGSPVPGSGIAFMNDTGQLIVDIPTDGNGNWSIDSSTDDGLLVPGMVVVFHAPGFSEYGVTASALPAVFNVKLDKKVTTILPWMIALVMAAVAYYIYSQNKKGRKVGKLETKDLLPIFLLAGGVIGFTIIKKILEKTGVWQSADDKAVDQISTDSTSFWSPTYWQQFSTFTYALTPDQAKQMAGTIYSAMGIFSDDATTVKGVFKSMKTKANVSYVANTFQNITGKDLFGYLKDGATSFLPWNGLNSTDLVEINTYLSQLPNN